MFAVIALAVDVSINVLDLVNDAALHEALGKVFALLGIYTGSALALTVLANMGNRHNTPEPFKG